MLAVPTMTLAVGWIAARGRVARTAVALALLLVAGVNIVLSVTRAESQAVTEQRVQREFSATVALLQSGRITASSGALPIRNVALDLTVADVEAAVRHGLVTPVPFEPADTAAVEASIAAG